MGALDVPVDNANLRRDTTRPFDTIEVYGHSYTIPQQVAQAAGWWAMLAYSLGVGAVLRGVGGTRVATAGSSGRGGWDKVLGSHARAPYNSAALRRLAIIMFGINDAGWGIPSAMFIAAMRSVIRRAQCCAVMEETDASIAYGGTWSTTSTTAASGGALTKAASTGVTATITVPATVPTGSTLVLRSTHDYATTTPWAATNGGTFSVTKNGAAQSAWNINAAGGNPTNGIATYTDIYEISVNPGDVIVLNATAVTSEIRFDGYDVIPPSPQPVLVAIPGYARPGVYTTYTAINAGLTQAAMDATVTSYRSALATLCTQLGVMSFDLERAVGRDQDMFLLDNLHPSSLGQPAIARAAIEAMNLTPRREVGIPAPYGGTDAIQASVTKTASVALSTNSPSSGYYGFGKVRSSVWHVNVTAISGTTPSAIFRVVSYNLTDGTWHTIATSAAITAVGKYTIVLTGGGWSDILGVELDLTGTTPSITYTVADTHQC